MRYCAIIGDIVGSKQLENRNQTQIKLKNTLDEINAVHNNNLAANFTITLGDEFQGLLFSAQNVYDIIKTIRRKMHPVKFVFGVGIGEIYTANIKKEYSIGADGPAYYYAREMVERAKSKKPTVCFYSDSIEDELLNSLVLLIETIEAKRTKKQMDAVHRLEEVETQKEVAKHFSTTASAISQLLKNALYHEVTSAEDKINDYLKNKLSK